MVETKHSELEKFSLPDRARVWVFQSDRFITEDEKQALENNGRQFAAQWKAHGKQLTAEFEVLHDLFVVMAIDEEVEGASGCSIDTFMRFVQEAQNQLNLNLTNRLCFAYTQAGKVHLSSPADVKKQIENGTFHKETLVFDNLVKNLGELRNNWTKPAQALWLKQYFPLS